MAALSIRPMEFAVTHRPAAATQATIASPSPAANTRVIITGLSATITGDAAAVQAGELVLRDGATGAGTILHGWTLAAAAALSTNIVAHDVNIPMTAGNVATLEFVAAGAGASLQRVNLRGYMESSVA